MSYPPQTGQEWYWISKALRQDRQTYGCRSAVPNPETTFALSKTPIDDHVNRTRHGGIKTGDRSRHFTRLESPDLFAETGPVDGTVRSRIRVGIGKQMQTVLRNRCRLVV